MLHVTICQGANHDLQTDKGQTAYDHLVISLLGCILEESSFTLSSLATYRAPMGVSLNRSHIRVHGDRKGWPKVPNPTWTSLKTSTTMALVNFPQGTCTGGTPNWLTLLTMGIFSRISTVRATNQYYWVGLIDTPDVSCSVLEGGGFWLEVSLLAFLLGTWLKSMQIQILFPTASLIFTAVKVFHQVICERKKHKASTASYP